MSAKFLKVVLPFALLPLVTGCIDDNYDLSDIDTTTQLKVNDLTLPINIDAITLDDIISVKDDDQIKEVTDINGNSFYAFTESGVFSSDPISISEVKISAPTLESASTAIPKIASPSVGSTARYDFTEIERTFHFTTHSVDKSIIDIKSAQTAPLKLEIEFDCPGVSQIASKAELDDVQIRLIKGLTATETEGSYDANTGIWSIPSHVMNGDKAKFTLTATQFDFAAAGIAFDSNTHTLDVPGEFTITSGEFILTSKSSDLPDKITVQTNYTIDDVDFNAITGRLSYVLDGMDVNPINLTDIPDFLNGDGTNIFLANPQIYINVNNPVADDKLACQAGLTLVAKRPGQPDVPDYTYSALAPINIGYDKGVSGPYNFVLAPQPSADDINIIDDTYAQNLTGISFPGLSDILAVPTESAQASLPEQIEVTLTDPQIVESDVTDFRLGRTIEGVEGAYQFVAPLALGDGTQIIYTGTEDGWNDEDVDAIEISSITVTADVTNNTPLDAEMKAYPLDVNGNRISGVTISGATVKAGAVDTPITIVLTGTVTHLDGLTYTATLHPGSDQTLTPQQNISLKNIKAKVSGSYTKKL
jgi:hypothetical protein